jgi:anti-sigma-K factor RskA
MTESCQVHDDVEAYVLGALSARERDAFERHLSDCPSCRREVASYLPVLNGLREIPLPAVPPLRPPTRRVVPLPLRRALTPLAAAVALAIGGFGGAAMQPAANSDMMTVAAMGVTSAEQVRLRGGDGIEGRAIVGEAGRRTAFVVAGLPQPGPQADYQVWVGNGTMASPGVLHRSAHGYELLVVPGDLLRDAKTITITLEPAGGSPHMTGRPLITAPAHEV